MKKLYFIIILFSFFACDLENPWPIDTDVQDVSGAPQIKHTVTYVISGNAPMITSDIIEDEYYYGLEDGINYTKTFQISTTSYSPDYTASFTAQKQTSDTTTLSGSIAVDGATVASDLTNSESGIINLSFVITDSF